ncbi:methionine--tRNA ligase [Pelodictyon phaeoclathratiforme]|jgi:methionyl-tRNA synthetase|uniref:Methionine--tRNA ligase n=1 Tax=Pelodictyon phaeoclathratiforme (strain DSM 5477 / BU-1) TaxID=324925 RepID=SYM_PELPB|nr:methionine--tRNA ligase [Pelodictyon phaeoclathratiforme]B4SGQ6.1 RecName: Full=Methionine--tRNA ligase; AltName: Full=Methionyl-tRNA synthetase; Short=MetRS [Pelodictyon phaeoclathratiforme BU-1]ACF43469.1 methionyl-tRNA synthetase [Pelodictyon phaeoclathratiforme BU-1]MBV5290183.1 methionine--tRNA ligase [Pelodictyon phaeoclathratiforme]
MHPFTKTLVTTALPYANGPVHLGHLAGVYLPADLYVRYMRLKGEDIIHIGGSDEHGVPITITAEREGISPKDVVDRYHRMNSEAFSKCGISFDYYGRTTSEVHHKTAQEFFTDIEEKGIFIRKSEKLFFDRKADRFLSDRYVTGTCPICNNTEANGDQCEQCGTHLSPLELINPKSKLSDATPELRETMHWYFPLGRFQDQLESYVHQHEDDWRQNVLNYTHTWLKQGLKDRAITRDLSWGIKVPLESEEAEGKVLYVWFDAVLGYISFTREWAEKLGQSERWKEYWQNPECRLLHFIGKDNVVFHTLMLPAILMAWNEGRQSECYNLADNVPASEFMNFEGRKFSKSRNYAVYLGEFLEKFPADTLRYSIAMNYPENKDTDFSWQDFQNRTNGELADTLGNFIKRSVDFTNARFDGEVPWDYSEDLLNNVLLCDQIDDIARAYDGFHFREAVSSSMDIARNANRFLTQNEPWKLIKTDPDAAARVMSISLNLCHALSILFYPVIPETCNRIHAMLGFDGTIDSLIKPGVSLWEQAKKPGLNKGHRLLGKSEILFTKIEDADIAPELKKIELLVAEAEKREAGAEQQKMEFKPLISFDDFLKVDLRVARVITAEKVKKAAKLLKLQLQVGSATKQVLAGIAKYYTPEEMVGKNVVIVANLADRTIRDDVSEGMILAVEGADGKLFVIEPEGEEINGRQIQ